MTVRMLGRSAKLAPVENVERLILLIRGQKVILDADLAELYGVPTKVLVQTVKRNADRFPSDFMFQLAPEEFAHLRSQFVTSSWGGRRYPPFAFTEHGVAMLSSVLRSRRAVQVNIAIMRAFVRLRATLALHTELGTKLSALERKIAGHDESIRTLFEAIRQLMTPSRVPSSGPPATGICGTGRRWRSAWLPRRDWPRRRGAYRRKSRNAREWRRRWKKAISNCSRHRGWPGWRRSLPACSITSGMC